MLFKVAKDQSSHRALLEQLENPEQDPADVSIQARMIVRNSTAPPPGTPSVTVGVGVTS